MGKKNRKKGKRKGNGREKPVDQGKIDRQQRRAEERAARKAAAKAKSKGGHPIRNGLIAVGGGLLALLGGAHLFLDNDEPSSVPRDSGAATAEADSYRTPVSGGGEPPLDLESMSREFSSRVYDTKVDTPIGNAYTEKLRKDEAMGKVVKVHSEDENGVRYNLFLDSEVSDELDRLPENERNEFLEYVKRVDREAFDLIKRKLHSPTDEYNIVLSNLQRARTYNETRRDTNIIRHDFSKWLRNFSSGDVRERKLLESLARHECLHVGDYITSQANGGKRPVFWREFAAVMWEAAARVESDNFDVSFVYGSFVNAKIANGIQQHGFRIDKNAHNSDRYTSRVRHTAQPASAYYVRQALEKHGKEGLFVFVSSILHDLVRSEGDLDERSRLFGLTNPNGSPLTLRSVYDHLELVERHHLKNGTRLD